MTDIERKALLRLNRENEVLKIEVANLHELVKELAEALRKYEQCREKCSERCVERLS